MPRGKSRRHYSDDSTHPKLNNRDKIITANRIQLWSSPKITLLLQSWQRVIHSRRIEHLKMWKLNKARYYFLGIPASIIGAFVAIGSFATFRHCDPSVSDTCDAEQWLRFVNGVFAAGGTALTSIMTITSFQSKSDRHKEAATQYDALYRSIEVLLQLPPAARDDPISTIQHIRNQIDDISAIATLNIEEGLPSMPETPPIMSDNENDLDDTEYDDIDPRSADLTDIKVDPPVLAGSTTLSSNELAIKRGRDLALQLELERMLANTTEEKPRRSYREAVSREAVSREESYHETTTRDTQRHYSEPVVTSGETSSRDISYHPDGTVTPDP